MIGKKPKCFPSLMVTMRMADRDYSLCMYINILYTHLLYSKTHLFKRDPFAKEIVWTMRDDGIRMFYSVA